MCANEPQVNIPESLELVSLDLPVNPLEDGATIQVDAQIWVDERPITNTEQISARIADLQEHTELLGAGPFHVNVLIAKEVEASLVATVLQNLNAAGQSTVRLAAMSHQPSKEVEYRVPDLAAEVEAEFNASGPHERQMALAQRWSRELGLCPPAGEAFKAVAYASAERKCQLLAYGLAEAQPMCPLVMNPDRAHTLLAFTMRPTHDFQPTWFEVTLDPAAAGITVNATDTWQQIAPLLLSEAGSTWVHLQ